MIDASSVFKATETCKLNEKRITLTVYSEWLAMDGYNYMKKKRIRNKNIRYNNMY